MSDVNALVDETLKLIECGLLEDPGNELLLSAEKHCKKSLPLIVGKKRKEAVQSWMQGELDATYYSESVQVEAEFPDYQQVHLLLGWMDCYVYSTLIVYS
jgi:hypothetical protein